jgi:hypothetical protein
MGRFNNASNKSRNPGPRSAVRTAVVPGTREPVRKRTALGARGYGREAQSELFLLAVSFMDGGDILHERESERYRRLVALCNDESVFADEVWCYNFINYLRNDAQMRTVSIVIAVEIVRARLSLDLFGGAPSTHAYTTKNARAINTSITPRNRQLIDVACSRADEPCEVLAYYTSRYGQSKWDGKLIPQPILSGVGDAAVRLWDEFSVLKYSGGGEGKKTVSMKDLLRLARPTPKDAAQAALFGWITGTESHKIVNPHTFLPMITERQKMNSIPRDERIHYLFGDYNATL